MGLIRYAPGWTRQPQEAVRLRQQWRDCLVMLASQHQLVAKPTAAGMGVTQAVALSNTPCVFGVFGTSIVVGEIYVGGTPAWNGNDPVYGDTSTDWPNDLGLRLSAASAYGKITIMARDTGGSVRYAGVDVTPGGDLAAGQCLVRGASISASGVVTGYGDGVPRGTDSTLSSYTFSPPATGVATHFGQNGTTDTATHCLWLVRAPRVLTDDEHRRLATDPYNTLFAPRQIWVPTASAGPSMPTLSLPTVTAIGATQATPRVTLTY